MLLRDDEHVYALQILNCFPITMPREEIIPALLYAAWILTWEGDDSEENEELRLECMDLWEDGWEPEGDNDAEDETSA